MERFYSCVIKIPQGFSQKETKIFVIRNFLVALSIQVVFDTIKTGIFVSISQPIRIKMFVHHYLRVDLEKVQILKA